MGALSEEFDRLADAGQCVEIWWRDDDAIEATPALDRLLALVERSGWPVSLAAIPSLIRPSLPERIALRDDVTVLVHGWAHANHAPPDAKPAEFGPDRPEAPMVRDADRGLAAIMAAFARALPVFVPPWNRMAPSLPANLARLGYRAVSCFGRPAQAGPIARLDTHLDPVDWRGSRSLLPPEALVAQLRRALEGGATRIGLLTHHLMQDEALWRFCSDFAALAARHPAIRPIGLSHRALAALPDRAERAA